MHFTFSNPEDMVVDDYGNELAIGDQKDIGEFNLVFLSRIEDGFEESRK